MDEDSALASHEYTFDELKILGDKALAESKIVRAVATKMIREAAQMTKELKATPKGKSHSE